MGMFDKDKEYGLRLDQEYPVPDRKKLGSRSDDFIIFSTDIRETTIPTKFGDAEVAEFETAHLETPDIAVACSTVATAIVEKVKEAETEDFPAVVRLLVVEGRNGPALALQYVRDWK